MLRELLIVQTWSFSSISRSRHSQIPNPKWVWLNAWAADDLQAKVGDRIDLVYLVSKPDGDYREDSITLTLTGIVEMTGPGADRGLTPAFEGITDTDRIDKWNAPFPVDMNRIRPADEDYWNRYRTAPKAFISLDTARHLAKRVLGRTRAAAGSLPVSSRQRDGPGWTGRLEQTDSCPASDPKSRGWSSGPSAEIAIDASAGTTDFGQLFLGMSLFLVIAGAGLAGTLMRLSAERRASEAGIMMACGFDERRARRVLFGEGLCLTVIGVALGVPMGVLYAAGVIAALRSWWIGAVGTSALWLHLTGSERDNRGDIGPYCRAPFRSISASPSSRGIACWTCSRDGSRWLSCQSRARPCKNAAVVRVVAYPRRRAAGAAGFRGNAARRGVFRWRRAAVDRRARYADLTLARALSGKIGNDFAYECSRSEAPPRIEAAACS